jgi:RHS repeat-associated protein
MGCLKLTYYYQEEAQGENSFFSGNALEKRGQAEKKRLSPYRFGFNGMERDDEIKGLGNSYMTEFRQYDSRLGRWLSVDPLFSQYTSYSPYAFVRNNPLSLIDPTGLGDEKTNKKPVKDDVNQAAAQGKTEGNIRPVEPATPLANDDGTPNTNAYNCHSYAWCNSQGSPSDPENKGMVSYGITKWDQNPENNTAGYEAIPFDQANQVGDRIIYYNQDKQGNVVPTHSAIVTGVDANGNTTEATSKWGQFGTYKHHPRDVPGAYSADAPTATTSSGQTYSTRVYYRKVSSSDVGATQRSANQRSMSLPPLKIDREVTPVNATYVAPPVIIPLKY